MAGKGFGDKGGDVDNGIEVKGFGGVSDGWIGHVFTKEERDEEKFLEASLK
jgi:hypothetical protein